MMRSFIFLALGTLILFSCDCVQTVCGTVMDPVTNKPIVGALVYKEGHPNDKTYTDSLGHFELESISGGPFGCPLMNIIIEKKGYLRTTDETDCRDKAPYWLVPEK